MTSSSIDRKIEQIARRQHGAFNAEQAALAGATGRMRRRRLANGRWLRLDRGVYALPSHPGTWQRQCCAAVLTIEGAALSHTSAGAVHGLTGCRPGRIHIVVAPGTNHRTGLAAVHESSWPRIGIVDGLRTVELADTFFQLAAVVSAPALRRSFEDAVVEHRNLLPTLRDRYVALAPRRLPGIRALRLVLDEHGEGAVPAESELERLLGRLLDHCEGIPHRTRQVALPGWDTRSARVDVLVPAWRLVIEADGRRWHTRVSDFESDRWRDNRATSAGYDVLRFSYHQLTAGRDECLALLSRYAAWRSAA